MSNTILPISLLQAQLKDFLVNKICDDNQDIYVEAFPNDPKELFELVHKENLALVSFENAERVLQNESFSQGKLSSINAYNKRGCSVARWSIKFSLWFSLSSYYYRSCIMDAIDYIVSETEGYCLVKDQRLSPMSVFSVDKVKFDAPDNDHCVYYYKASINTFLTTTGSRPLEI